MSIDGFVISLNKQISDLKDRKKATSSMAEKTAIKKQIKEIEAVIHKATRRGLEE